LLGFDPFYINLHGQDGLYGLTKWSFCRLVWEGLILAILAIFIGEGELWDILNVCPTNVYGRVIVSGIYFDLRYVIYSPFPCINKY